VTTAIGVICAGNVKMECVQSLIGALGNHIVDTVYLHQSGPYLDDGRNFLVRVFNSPELEHCDRLLMVDSDIEFSPEDVTKLAEDDLPVVSGVYYNPVGQGVLPVVYQWGDLDGRHRLLNVTEWGDEGPISEVDGVGAGFLMIGRDVFHKLEFVYGEPQPWFAEDIVDGIHYGEDLTFCLRAKEAGFSIHVDRDVQVAHHKSARLKAIPMPV
jgi:hypothetical protein